jgi:hypothetical protein
MGLNKSDTVMRIDYSASATVDQSQFGQTLTASGVGGYLDPSAETALDGSGAGREYSVEFQGNNGKFGILIYHGNDAGTSIGFQARVAATVVTITDSSGTIGTITLPLPQAYNQTYRLFVCTRPNPLTTGASDAHVTEAMLHNTVGSTSSYFAFEQWTHAVGTISASDAFSYAGRWNVSYLADTYGPGVGIDACRVGGRFKSTTESVIDWGSYTASTPATGEDQSAPFIAPDSSSEIGDGGNVAGPAYQLAGKQVGTTSRRLVSPLTNQYYNDAIGQGRTNAVECTVNSTEGATVSAAIANNPGSGDGPSGWPEVCRTFTAASSHHFEYAGVPDFISTIQTADSTISMWIKWDDTGSHPQTIAGQCGGGGASGADNDCAVISVTSTGAVTFGYHHGSGSTAVTHTSTATLTAGTWSHVAFVCTVSGGNLTVATWIDGTLDSSNTDTAPDLGSGSEWQIGRYYDAGATTYSQYFDGSICEIKISDSAYPNDWIEFESSRAQGYLYQEGELAHWQFRQPSDGYAPRRAYMDVTLGSDTYKAHLDTLIRRPVHAMTGKWLARVLAMVQYNSTYGGTVDTINLAVVATNRQPGKVAIGGPPAKKIYATAAVNGTVNQLSWYTVEGYELPRDDDGQCWFYLASEITTAGTAGDTAIKFRGLQVIPYSADATSDYPLPIAAP